MDSRQNLENLSDNLVASLRSDNFVGIVLLMLGVRRLADLGAGVGVEVAVDDLWVGQVEQDALLISVLLQKHHFIIITALLQRLLLK